MRIIFVAGLLLSSPLYAQEQPPKRPPVEESRRNDQDRDYNQRNRILRPGIDPTPNIGGYRGLHPVDPYPIYRRNYYGNEYCVNDRVRYMPIPRLEEMETLYGSLAPHQIRALEIAREEYYRKAAIILNQR